MSSQQATTSTHLNISWDGTIKDAPSHHPDQAPTPPAAAPALTWVSKDTGVKLASSRRPPGPVLVRAAPSSSISRTTTGSSVSSAADTLWPLPAHPQDPNVAKGSQVANQLRCCHSAAAACSCCVGGRRTRGRHSGTTSKSTLTSTTSTTSTSSHCSVSQLLGSGCHAAPLVGLEVGHLLAGGAYAAAYTGRYHGAQVGPLQLGLAELLWHAIKGCMS
jgi:hypothetical protein